MSLFALFVVFLRFSLSSADYLLAERVKLVASSNHNETTNFLFRGNMPLTYGSLCDERQRFDWDGLTHAMKKQAVQNDLQFPEKFLILDISLVTARTKCPDLHDLSRELSFSQRSSSFVQLMFPPENYWLFGSFQLS